MAWLVYGLLILFLWMIIRGHLIPRKTGLQVRKDHVDVVQALPDPYDTAYPIRTLDEVLAGLDASIRWRFTAAAQPCPVGPSDIPSDRHQWLVHRDSAGPGAGWTYTWSCRNCNASTDNQELVISQGWRPRSARKNTRQFLRDLDASLELEAPAPMIEISFGTSRVNAFASHLQASVRNGDDDFNRRAAAGWIGYGNHPYDF